MTCMRNTTWSQMRWCESWNKEQKSQRRREADSRSRAVKVKPMYKVTWSCPVLVWSMSSGSYNLTFRLHQGSKQGLIIVWWTFVSRSWSKPCGQWGVLSFIMQNSTIIIHGDLCFRCGVCLCVVAFWVLYIFMGTYRYYKGFGSSTVTCLEINYWFPLNWCRSDSWGDSQHIIVF